MLDICVQVIFPRIVSSTVDPVSVVAGMVVGDGVDVGETVAVGVCGGVVATVGAGVG
jgi:hypothetical protein